MYIDPRDVIDLVLICVAVYVPWYALAKFSERAKKRNPHGYVPLDAPIPPRKRPTPPVAPPDGA